jgi:FHIPEP family
VAGRGRLIPPRNLLEQVDGVTQSLQRGRRLHAIGWTAFLLSLFQVVVVVFASDWWNNLSTFKWGELGHHWLLVATTLVLIVSFVFINWTRFWVRESKQPFRYTLSIDNFESIGGIELPARLRWLRDDLAARLNNRIPRLSLLDPRFSPQAAAGDSHVHVGGTLGFRRNDNDALVIEVFPWLRLGPATEASNLAHPVRFALREGTEEFADDAKPGSYEKLVERIYFSIASELYRQIRSDVETKILLLPRRYFRAAAYYHEATDYLRSNTLDAYIEAQRLFDAVVELYEPRWQEASSWPLRQLRRVDAVASHWSLGWRRNLAEWRPSLGRVELMVARSRLGAADTLLYRRTLAKLSGRRVNAVFAARPLAEDALAQIEGLPAEVPDRDRALFDAHVTLASSLAALGAESDAERELEEAQRLDPRRAERNSRFLYVRGLTSTQGPYQYFRRAVESDPFFEAAQFQLAVELELIWRRRPTLERTVARIVLDEYEAVLQLNPGNLAAWANMGYVYWLLGEDEDLERARLALDRGREYKEITRETSVAELDYVLARVEAERDEFEAAYKVYIASVNAQLAEGVSHAVDRPTAYHFVAMSSGILRRFEAYEEKVRALWQKRRQERTNTRILNSVYGFVLNDYGEACMNYFLRTGNGDFLDRAQKAFTRAQRSLTTRYPVIYYNLHLIERLRSRLPAWRDFEGCDLTSLSYGDLLAGARSHEVPKATQEHIKQALVYEPSWPDAILEHALLHVTFARQERRLARLLERVARECERRQDEYESTLLESKDGRRGGRVNDRVLVRSHGHLSQVVNEVQDRSKAEAKPLLDRFLDEPVKEAVEVPAVPGSNAVVIEEAAERPTDSRAEARRRARELEQVRTALRDSVADLCSSAERNETAAAKHARTLVKHKWAWRPPEAELPELPPRIAERELDDVHARALLVVCMSALQRPATEKEADELLCALLDRFLPGDFGALLDYWEIREPKNTTYSDRLADLVSRSIKREPALRTLPWIDSGFVSAELRRKLLRGVLYERNVPDEALIFIGKALSQDAGDGSSRAADKEDPAEKAFRLARKSRDPFILLTVSQSLAAHERWDEAAAALRRALALSRDESPTIRAEILLDHAVAVWHIGRPEAAVKDLRAVGEMRDEIWPTWRGRVTARLVSTVDSSASYRLLKDWLGHELTAAHGSSPEMLHDAASALLELTSACYHRLARRPLAVSLGRPAQERAASRLLIEADRGLFPAEESDDVRRLLVEQVPELRESLRTDTGLFLPPVAPVQNVELVSQDDAHDGAYRIHLDGVLVGEGRFAPEETGYLLRAEAEQRDISGRPGRDPLGAEIAWVEPGTEARSRYSYVLAHLEAIVRSHLDRLVGYDQVDRILAAWEEGDNDEARLERLQLRRRALPDANTRRLLVASIRALAAEGIPPRDIEPVLDALAELGPSASVDDVAEAARRRLAPSLPGADQPASLQPLSPELEDQIEDWIHAHDSGRFLAMPDTELTRLRGSLVATVSAPNRGSGILVLRPGLRPFVRKLVALDEPEVPVVDRLELGTTGLPPRVDRPSGEGEAVTV